MPYWVTIERLISWTSRRSSDARRDLAEDQVLCHAPSEEHDHVVEELLLRLQVAVLLRQVQRVAERLAARDDRDAVDLLHRLEELRAQRVAGLVVGHHLLLVLGDHAARLHARHDALGAAWKSLVTSASRWSRPAKIAASLQMFARSAPVMPLVWRATASMSTSSASGLPRVDREDAAAPLRSGGGRDLAVEAARPKQSRVELLEQVELAMTTTLSASPKPSSSTSSWFSVWSFSPAMSLPRVDGVELVDEDDRRRGLARLAEQPPDTRGAEAGEHLDERRGRLREELRVRLARHRLGEQRLAGAGRAVKQDALRDLRAELLEALRVAHELHDLAQLVLGLLDARHVLPAHRARQEGAISCGFVRGMYWTIQTTATAIRPMKMIGR